MVNPERGEVELKLGEVKVTLAPEMARFAALSHSLGTKSLKDILERIQGMEPYTMYACVDAFTKDGDVVAIKGKMESFTSLSKVSQAMSKVIGALSDDDSKNE